MLCTHQRPELLTLCLVSLMTFSIYRNKLNSCTSLNSHRLSHNQREQAAAQLPLSPTRFQKWGSRRKCQTSFSPWHQQSKESAPLLRFFLHLHVGLLMSVKDMTQWLEHMSSLEKYFGRREKDSAGWLNQQQSFHVRWMLPFRILNRLRCAFYRFSLWQKREQRGECDYYHNWN